MYSFIVFNYWFIFLISRRLLKTCVTWIWLQMTIHFVFKTKPLFTHFTVHCCDSRPVREAFNACPFEYGITEWLFAWTPNESLHQLLVKTSGLLSQTLRSIISLLSSFGDSSSVIALAKSQVKGCSDDQVIGVSFVHSKLGLPFNVCQPIVSAIVWSSVLIRRLQILRFAFWTSISQYFTICFQDLLIEFE